MGKLGQAGWTICFVSTDDEWNADRIREFGMQGYPDMRTVQEWDNDKKQLFPQSRVSVNHNKAVSHRKERSITSRAESSRMASSDVSSFTSWRISVMPSTWRAMSTILR